jgi:chromosome segregation ATPase
LNNQYNKLFSKYNALLSENKELKNESLTLKAKLSEKEEYIKNLTMEVNDVIDTIKGIEESLNESFRWFQANAYLRDPSVKDIKSVCMRNSELNVPCVIISISFYFSFYCFPISS